MRKTGLALFALFALSLFAFPVSAGYIRLWASGSMQFNPGDSMTWDLPDWQGKIKIYISWSGHSSIYGDSTWNLYVYTDVDTFRIYHSGSVNKIYKNGALLVESYANTVVVDTNAGTVEFYNGGTLVTSTTTSAKIIDKISLDCPTKDANGNTQTDFYLTNLYVYKYSAYLDSLNVYDENTLEQVALIDFGEVNNTITVKDMSGVRASRTYELNNVTSLDAFLVPYSEGSYYTIKVDGAGPGVLVEALRDYGGQKKVVAQARTDENGQTSMFLANSKLYTFRVHLANSTFEVSKITDPNSPLITLSSSLIGGAIYVNASAPNVGVSWSPIGWYIDNTTSEITADIAVRSNDMVRATLMVSSGAFQNSEVLTGSPSGGTLSIQLPDMASLGDVVTATLTVETANQNYTFTKRYMVNKQYSADFSLEDSAKRAPGAWSVGEVGLLIGTVILSLLAATAIGAGSAGAGAIMLVAYMFFTYQGYLSKELAILGGLAALGLILRRGEA